MSVFSSKKTQQGVYAAEEAKEKTQTESKQKACMGMEMECLTLFRMLCDNYDGILNHDNIDKIRIVDMSQGKANDDGYRGVHLYFQLDHSHYPIEIQMNTYYDRQINNWLHKYLYKKIYPDDVGLKLRKLYENGKILNENMFREVLQNVLSDCKRI